MANLQLGMVQQTLLTALHFQETGVSVEDYSRSTIVQTSAPTEMGSLRKADGQEGFAAKATNAAQSAAGKLAGMVNGNGTHA